MALISSEHEHRHGQESEHGYGSEHGYAPEYGRDSNDTSNDTSNDVGRCKGLGMPMDILLGMNDGRHDKHTKDCRDIRDWDNKHDEPALARAYVPMQKLEKIYSADESLFRGTVFPALYSPYEPEKTEKKVLMR